MIKRLLKCVREFKTPTILTLVFIVCEVIIETFIPYITANLVNQIRQEWSFPSCSRWVCWYL